MSNSYKNHIDYVVLLRKIGLYFEIKINERLTTTESLAPESQRFALNEEDVVMSINIESGMRFKNPFNDLQAPSCSVVFKVPF